MPALFFAPLKIFQMHQFLNYNPCGRSYWLQVGKRHSY
jgi:hypothetical protein